MTVRHVAQKRMLWPPLHQLRGNHRRGVVLRQFPDYPKIRKEILEKAMSALRP